MLIEERKRNRKRVAARAATRMPTQARKANCLALIRAFCAVVKPLEAPLGAFAQKFLRVGKSRTRRRFCAREDAACRRATMRDAALQHRIARHVKNAAFYRHFLL